MTAIHVALDGSLAELSGPFRTDTPATVYARVADHLFESSTLPAIRDVLAQFEVNDFDESYSVQGGTLHRATRVLLNQQSFEVTYSFGVWEGKTHAVKTNIGPEFPSSEVIELFELFDITEDVGGLSMTPRDRSILFDRDWRSGPRVAKRAPDVGIFVIRPRTTETEAHLPPYGGTPVSDGEVYQDGPSDDGRFLYTHVSSNAVTTLWPGWPVNTSAVARALEEMQVDWSNN